MDRDLSGSWIEIIIGWKTFWGQYKLTGSFFRISLPLIKWLNPSIKMLHDDNMLWVNSTILFFRIIHGFFSDSSYQLCGVHPTMLFDVASLWHQWSHLMIWYMNLLMDRLDYSQFWNHIVEDKKYEKMINNYKWIAYTKFSGNYD